MLVFQVFPDFTFIARLGRGRLDARVVPLTRLRARELVARWHRRVQADWSRTDDPHPVAEELATALKLAELLADLPHRVTRLVVIADDALHGFPFPALRVGGEYLAEQFAISHRYTTRPDARPERPVPSALVAAIPDVASAVRRASLQVSQGWPTRGPRPTRRAQRLERPRQVVLTGWGRTSTRGGAPGCMVSGRLRRYRLPPRSLPGRTSRTAPGWPWLVRFLARRADHQRDGSPPTSAGNEYVTLSSCQGADNFVFPGQPGTRPAGGGVRAGAGKRRVSALWPHQRRGCTRVRRALPGPPPEASAGRALQRAQCDFIGSAPESRTRQESRRRSPIRVFLVGVSAVRVSRRTAGGGAVEQ